MWPARRPCCHTKRDPPAFRYELPPQRQVKALNVQRSAFSAQSAAPAGILYIDVTVSCPRVYVFSNYIIFFPAMKSKRSTGDEPRAAKRARRVADKADFEVATDARDASGSDVEFAGFDDTLDASASSAEEAAEALESAPAASTSSSTSREQRLEQKRQKKERKLKKAHGEAVEQIKLIWEDIRAKQGVSAEARQRGVHEIVKLVDGRWRDLVFRHDASRVVQTVFKHADKALKQEITRALQGTYVELAKSAYGKYLLVKMLHYGSPAVRAAIIDEMHGSFRKLMSHKEGAYVLEDLYRDYATAKQRRQIMREFYGGEFALFKDAHGESGGLREIVAAAPAKKPHILENLNKTITQAVNKGSIGFEIVHAMMLEYVRNLEGELARETFVDLVADDVVEMAHTNAGSQVASLVFAIATAKERKRLLKSVRQYPLKLAKDNYGSAVVMAAFLTVDDTRLVHKAFEELGANMAEVLQDKYARRPLLMLLTGPEDKRYFAGVSERLREVNERKQLTSKKDDATRQHELLVQFEPAVARAFREQAAELAASPLALQFVGEYARHAPTAADALQPVLDLLSEDPADPEHILHTNPMSGRLSKLLVRTNDACRQQLFEAVQQHPLAWARGPGCFAVISLLETLEPSDAGGLKQALQAHAGALKKNDAKGATLLLELVSK